MQGGKVSGAGKSARGKSGKWFIIFENLLVGKRGLPIFFQIVKEDVRLSVGEILFVFPSVKAVLAEVSVWAFTRWAEAREGEWGRAVSTGVDGVGWLWWVELEGGREEFHGSIFGYGYFIKGFLRAGDGNVGEVVFLVEHPILGGEFTRHPSVATKEIDGGPFEAFGLVDGRESEFRWSFGVVV